MTNIIKINAIVASVLLLIGTIFKSYHWPGASVLLIAGIAGLITFLVLLIISFRRDRSAGLEQFTRIFVAAVLIIILLAILFKIMHWAGAQKLLWVGDVGIFISFVLCLTDGFLEKDPAKWGQKFITAIFILILLLIIIMTL